MSKGCGITATPRAGWSRQDWSHDHRYPRPPLAGILRKLTDTVREMNDAARRMTEIRLTRPLGFGDEVPATYAEFLLRTSATSAHAPTAARRQAAGRGGGSAGPCRC